ncbi:microcin ABC transporter ATP-binding protein [Photobacterium jeanii]|uniref:Microcin ABC transporter ATP-binding protein n=1 Tax=Photobacterium jeanii TaxID=858640 RepID=A0A178KAC0_9GAMM|nr:ABC transporter ATP-binding protein [Photobacterium jeanii]OAN14299.1 microcin ABC transporter ATP-binding protein [Photobacterium jeanii]PST89820.1 ABC transporter ATP-binding protein [Photobacterium jeanii]
MAEQHPLLEVCNLSVSFQMEAECFDAVKGISFTLEKGQTLALVGESGSGKSVSSSSVMGLLPPNARIGQQSEIRFQGQDLLGMSEKNFRSIRGDRIAMIFQEPMTSLNPYMPVGEQVAEAIIHHRKVSKREAMESTLELFEKVHLPEPRKRLNHYPHEFSGGQLQRIMIAMALANTPDILVADEPTTALDVTVQAEVLNLLKEIQADMGMAILFITHDLGVVRHFADDVVVMCQGEVVETGTVEAVFTEPKHDYTKMLLNAEPKPGDLQHDQHAANILEVRDLKVNYILKNNWLGQPTEWLQAVKGIDLTLKEGQTVGIVGESGSGKSTMGRAIMQLLESEGEISFQGKRFDQLTSQQRFELKRNMQMVFQDPFGSLSPRMTIGEIITEPLTVFTDLSQRERLDKARKALEEVRLDPSSINRYPHEFSGGQRQRIAIARALILEPQFILLDEPTSALDRSVQLTVLELLKDIQKRRNIAYLFISHDLSVVRAISDEVIVMQKGAVVERGTPEQIFDNPQEVYTQRLIKACMLIDEDGVAA